MAHRNDYVKVNSDSILCPPPLSHLPSGTPSGALSQQWKPELEVATERNSGRGGWCRRSLATTFTSLS